MRSTRCAFRLYTLPEATGTVVTEVTDVERLRAALVATAGSTLVPAAVTVLAGEVRESTGLEGARSLLARALRRRRAPRGASRPQPSARCGARTDSNRVCRTKRARQQCGRHGILDGRRQLRAQHGSPGGAGRPPSQFARPPSALAALRHDPTPERMDVLRWFRTYLDASKLQNSGPAHDWWSTSDLTVMSPAPYVTWLLGSVWPCSSGAPAPTLPKDQATGMVRRMTRRPTRFCSALSHRVPRWRTLVRDRDTTRAGTLY